MKTSGPVVESPIECARRLANGAVEKGLIAGYAVAGAFAHLLASAPEAVDRRRLESILERHHLLEAWRRLQPEL